MNIKDCLEQLHPDLRLARQPGLLDPYYRLLWKRPYPGYVGPAPQPLSAAIQEWTLNDSARTQGTSPPVGLVICSWNRPGYLEHTLRSVAESDLSRVLTVIVDDASGDADSLQLVREFNLESPMIKIFKRERRQIHHSLDLGWSLLTALGCRYLTNLDADAIVAPEWLSVLERLYAREACGYSRLIASAFNRSREKYVVSEHNDFKVKTRMGGLNYFFAVDLYPELRVFLLNTVWDLLVQAYFEVNYARGYRMVCTRPSYVQHIGRIGINSGPFQRHDVADDFVGMEPTPGP